MRYGLTSAASGALAGLAGIDGWPPSSTCLSGRPSYQVSGLIGRRNSGNFGDRLRFTTVAIHVHNCSIYWDFDQILADGFFTLSNTVFTQLHALFPPHSLGTVAIPGP